ncbi:putative disease resistance RPP13-like protein 1 [Olea europaea var. sylvestris]|uniref:putative disease resistance RPP13-like protein 1 n=1 Tax=Olea europaea var. sylvestris TaxID=158386 RepID=UPI000C1D3711|nr:putative disease resistance RPP13-like protein 1 [Olea europaea var. sylvestris]
MAEAMITVMLTQLAEITEEQIRKQVRLVVGVKKDIEKLTSGLESIRSVLVDAEKRQVKDESVKLWLEKLKDLAYDMDDVLSEWLTAIRKAKTEGVEDSSLSKKKVWSFISLPSLRFRRFALRRDIALKIKGIKERLDVIATEKNRYNFNTLTESGDPERLKTNSYIDVSEVRGRDVDKNTLVSKLLSESSQSDGFHVVSVVGMGGIGKTTLAQMVYNCDSVEQDFERKMWVCVSEPFDEVRVAKAIVEDLEGNAPFLYELETVLRRLRNAISGKKFLLVLDDVWTDDYRKWEQLFNSLKIGASGSKILVTTRNERTAKMLRSSYELHLGQLADEDSWSLFSQIAFFERSIEDCEELEGIGRKIADKCRGIPLTVKTIGSLMRFKNSLQDWQNVLNSEFWEFEGAEKGLFPPLMLSYFDLPSTMKRCFSFCAFFPKHHVINASNLIKLWMAQGYLCPEKNVEMEVLGEEYLQNLAMRSFFQEIEKDKDGKRILRFKMHDMVHDFAQYLTKRECSVVEVDGELAVNLGSSYKTTRHLTLVRAKGVRFPTSIANAGKLHSFWVQSFFDTPPIISELDKIEPDLCNRSACLKVLDLSRNRLGLGYVTNADEARIAELSEKKHISDLHLDFNSKAQTGNQDEVIEALQLHPGLQSLKISSYGGTRFANWMVTLTSLKDLSLQECQNCTILPPLGRLPSLATLHIGGLHNLKSLGLEFLGATDNVNDQITTDSKDRSLALSSAENIAFPKLNKLKFSNMGSWEEWNMIRAANEHIKIMPRLRFLKLYNCSNLKALPHLLFKAAPLRKLHIQNCPLIQQKYKKETGDQYWISISHIPKLKIS